MHRVSSIATFMAVLGSLLAVPAQSAQSAITRTYVASYGSDANSATNCNFSAPCRTFQVALGQTTGGGEILALDGSGYGRLVIDRSVSIIANGGVFAGIGAPAGTNGIEIATAGVKVVLRGLTINGLGGSYGILMTNGATLDVQNCEVSGFGDPSGAAFGDSSPVGIYIKTAARVIISDTRVSNSLYGIRLARGATGEIFRVQATGNYIGITALSDAGDAGTLTTVSVSDSLASQHAAAGAAGFMSMATTYCASCSTSMTVTNSVASLNYHAFFASSGGSMTASGNRMVGNHSNYFNSGATLNSAGNNVARGGTNFGSITNVSATIFQ